MSNKYKSPLELFHHSSTDVAGSDICKDKKLSSSSLCDLAVLHQNASVIQSNIQTHTSIHTCTHIYVFVVVFSTYLLLFYVKRLQIIIQTVTFRFTRMAFDKLDQLWKMIRNNCTTFIWSEIVTVTPCPSDEPTPVWCLCK